MAVQFMYTYLRMPRRWVRQLLDFIAFAEPYSWSVNEVSFTPATGTWYDLSSPKRRGDQEFARKFVYLLRLRTNYSSSSFLISWSPSLSSSSSSSLVWLIDFYIFISFRALHRVTSRDEKEMKRDFSRPGEYFMDLRFISYSRSELSGSLFSYNKLFQVYNTRIFADFVKSRINHIFFKQENFKFKNKYKTTN